MRYKFIILLFLIALVSGFFWNQKIFNQPFIGDPLYDGVAHDLLEKGTFTFQGKDTFVEPFYPLFLAGIYKIFGYNYDAVRIFQVILFALTAVFAYLIALEIFGPKIAFWPALATALFYGIANQAGLLMTETLFIFLITLLVYLLYRASGSGRAAWFFAAGAALGLATLTRGITQFLFIILVANITILYFRKESLVKIISKSTIFLLAFFLILAPWLLRSGTVGASSAVAARGGRILLSRVEWMEKLYPNYSTHFVGHLLGYYFAQKFAPNVSSSEFREGPYWEERIQGLLALGKSQVEIDDILLSEVKIKILKAPHKYVLMSILDFISLNSPIIPSGSFWGNTLTVHTMFAEGRHPEIPAILKAAVILSIRFVWFAFLFLVIYALIKNWKNWPKISWILLIILYFNLAYSALHAIPRYALPIYPFYVILAVVGIGQFFKFKWLSSQESKISGS